MSTTVYKNLTGTVHLSQNGVLMVQLMGNSVIQMALLLTLLVMCMWLILATTVYKNSRATVHSSQRGVLMVQLMDNSLIHMVSLLTLLGMCMWLILATTASNYFLHHPNNRNNHKTICMCTILANDNIIFMDTD